LATKTLKLTIQERRLICEQLKNAYSEHPQASDPLNANSNIGNYDELAELIFKQTDVPVISSWLRDFFTLDPGNLKRWNRERLKACCCFIYGSNISVEQFLSQKPSLPRNLIGRYEVHWTGTNRNSSNPTPHVSMVFDFQADKTVLTKINGEKFTGGPPAQIGEKAYVDVINKSRSEKALFIFHIGEADAGDLQYVPGIFAAGDRANVLPCAGPVLLVNEKIDEPLTLIIKEYFLFFANNNLIKSWSISEMLEMIDSVKDRLKTKQTEKEENKQQVRLDKKIALYLNQQFCLYFWSWDEKKTASSLGRAILKIGATPDAVTIAALSHQYSGRLSLLTGEHLLIDVKTVNTREKSLSIKVKIGPDHLHSFALGIYNIIGAHGTIEGGTILLETIKSPEKSSLVPKNFPFDEPRPDEINEHIWVFFKDKQRNYVKTPAAGIFEEEDFITFYFKQKQKKQLSNILTVEPGNGIFIATPISSNEKAFFEIRDQLVELKKELSEQLKVPVFFAGEQYEEEIGHHSAYMNAEIDFDNLRRSEYFIMIYPQKVPSSALIELGIALSEMKKCRIYYRNFDDLPLLIRKLNREHVILDQYQSIFQLRHFLEKYADDVFRS